MWIALTASALAQPEPTYSIRQDNAPIGSHVHKEVLRSEIPFDKRYEELTDAQRAIVRSWYKQPLPDGDEPPFPKFGLRTVARELLRFERELNFGGDLVVSVAVDAQGQAHSVAIHNSPNPVISQVVAVALMKHDYKPATCRGQPCAREFPLILHFVPR